MQLKFGPISSYLEEADYHDLLTKSEKRDDTSYDYCLWVKLDIEKSPYAYDNEDWYALVEFIKSNNIEANMYNSFYKITPNDKIDFIEYDSKYQGKLPADLLLTLINHLDKLNTGVLKDICTIRFIWSLTVGEEILACTNLQKVVE